MAAPLVKSLNRLPSKSLIDLALKWLDKTSPTTAYLETNRSLNESEEEDYLFPPAEDVDTLRKIYKELRSEEKDKPYLIDRILDGDWRRGLSLHQLATIDFAYLEHNDNALRWSALKVMPLDNLESLPKGFEERPAKRRKTAITSISHYPSIQSATFVASLKSHISPLVKAHYHIHRLPAPQNLTIIRIFISSRTAFAPAATNIPRSARHATDTGRAVYIALPQSCPYIYLALSSNTSTQFKSTNQKAGQATQNLASMKRMILEAIPKALSRPQSRWALESTKLTTRSLKSICELRGGGRPGTAGGAYSHFHEEESSQNNGSNDGDSQTKDNVQNSQVNTSGEGEAEEDTERKHKSTLRFGIMSSSRHAPLDRFHVKISDILPPTSPSQEARPSADAAPVSLSLSGTDVFLGLKKLAELDPEVVNLGKVPSWLTGERGSTTITV